MCIPELTRTKTRASVSNMDAITETDLVENQCPVFDSLVEPDYEQMIEDREARVDRGWEEDLARYERTYLGWD
jgi:hypothetical protein